MPSIVLAVIYMLICMPTMYCCRSRRQSKCWPPKETSSAPTKRRLACAECTLFGFLTVIFMFGTVFAQQSTAGNAAQIACVSDGILDDVSVLLNSTADSFGKLQLDVDVLNVTVKPVRMLAIKVKENWEPWPPPPIL